MRPRSRLFAGGSFATADCDAAANVPLPPLWVQSSRLVWNLRGGEFILYCLYRTVYGRERPKNAAVRVPKSDFFFERNARRIISLEFEAEDIIDQSDAALANE